MSAASSLFPHGICARPCYGRLSSMNVSGVPSIVCEQCGEVNPEFETEDVFGDEFYTTLYEPPQEVRHYNSPEARKRDAILASRYRDRSEYDACDDRSDIDIHPARAFSTWDGK